MDIVTEHRDNEENGFKFLMYSDAIAHTLIVKKYIYNSNSLVKIISSVTVSVVTKKAFS